MKHVVFSFGNLCSVLSYEHAKRRGITALTTACDRSDQGRAYSCARNEIRWQNRIKYEKMLLFIYKYYLLELQH